VVCTIQTFPFALKEVRELAATHGKRFAVIADEAYSSQTGEAAAKLKAVLSPEELAELNDCGEVSSEDILAAQMAARANDKGITYVAFTATPKAKTMELFGRRPSPDEPASDTNKPQPFHVYSMRQAIEEGFILDVLKNYTPLQARVPARPQRQGTSARSSMKSKSMTRKLGSSARRASSNSPSWAAGLIEIRVSSLSEKQGSPKRNTRMIRQPKLNRQSVTPRNARTRTGRSAPLCRSRSARHRAAAKCQTAAGSSRGRRPWRFPSAASRG
jgi:hypothetical protein